MPRIPRERDARQRSRPAGNALSLFGVALGVLIAAAAPAAATDISLIASPIPPFITEEGTGPVVRLVLDLARRVGNNPNVSVVPLGRALDLAHDRPAGIFLLGRSPEREDMLSWGPILVEEEMVLLTRTGAENAIGDLAAAKARHIGTLQHSVTEELLLEQGFGNVTGVPTNILAARMLDAGRFDAWCVPLHAADAAIRAAALPPKGFRNALTLSKLPLYLAFSHQVPQADIDRWSAAFRAMQADGSYRVLMTEGAPGQAVGSER
ncbi:MAG TPA: hypothetical protein VGV37_25580 [Aliidongia sp.]|uniref:substrate-binding periplasmic protein n=1 Tax=Aliidongia sp. TaxID=1914230 RepID=UPI002DDCB6FF|nr:hypothetical protein [Aliidongia sp.]HEV2677928.1 hypothetical protein [Aliidongia sp.]